MAPMRIAYFNYEWNLQESSGAGRHITEMVGALRSLGHTVAVHDRHRRRDAPGAGTGARGGGRASVRERLSPYLHEAAAVARCLRGIGEETAILRRERPDVVLTRYSMHQLSSLVAARRVGVPIVLEVNAPLAYEYRRYRPEYHLLPGFGEWTELRLLRAVDEIFVVSSVLKRYFAERGVSPDRMSVVPNGADVEAFRPDVVDAGVRARLGHGRVIIAFVGSFAGFHGVGMLRDAMAEVLPVRPDAAFLMVGHGRHSLDLEAFCRAQGFADRVLFTGHVPRERVPAMMATADVLVAPYAYEEFFYFSPIKLFEYLACGRAILAAGVGQIGEVVEHDVNGLLYDPREPASFRSQMLRLVDDGALRHRLGVAARRAAESRYTWRVNGERVAAVLERALGQRPFRHDQAGGVVPEAAAGSQRR